VKLILALLILLFFSSTQLFAQDVVFKDYKSEAFEFKYPSTWKVDTIEGKLSFYFNANQGDITISTYSDQHLSSKEIKQLLLNVNEIHEAKPDVQISTSNGTIAGTYKYTSDKIKYVLKAIQKDGSLHFISLNWNEASWDAYKDVLLGSLNSFRPK
jgi:hypothetical protein